MLLIGINYSNLYRQRERDGGGMRTRKKEKGEREDKTCMWCASYLCLIKSPKPLTAQKLFTSVLSLYLLCLCPRNRFLSLRIWLKCHNLCEPFYNLLYDVDLFASLVIPFLFFLRHFNSCWEGEACWFLSPLGTCAPGPLPRKKSGSPSLKNHQRFLLCRIHRNK